LGQASRISPSGRNPTMSTTTILVIVVLILLFGGGWGYSRRGR
jgi:cell division protein FtsX